ncbi:hypothetical protein BJF78_14275 [Pseudonocardia sp. CNS-139]|nr:hypothetical protein BJF78_14275 [Pseudonocardia sp. CNS-139]
MQTDVTPPRPSRDADDRPDRLPLDELPRWVPHADPVALLLTTAHLTGDLALLRDEWRPDLRIGVTEGGYPEPVREEIRRTCLDALGKAGETWDRDRPTYDTLQRVVEWAMRPEFAAYTPLLGDTLSFGPGDDPGRPSWTLSGVGGDPDFRVAVVGAGESGLLMAHRLRQAGVPVVVFERNADVGGTWHENTYPGCRVDIPSQVYRYSSHPGTWESHFSTRPAIAEYLRGFARDNGLYDCIELGSEVLGSRWDGERRRWVLTVRSAAGIREVPANVQVSAVGQFGRRTPRTSPGPSGSAAPPSTRRAGTAPWTSPACGSG